MNPIANSLHLLWRWSCQYPHGAVFAIEHKEALGCVLSEYYAVSRLVSTISAFRHEWILLIGYLKSGFKEYY